MVYQPKCDYTEGENPPHDAIMTQWQPIETAPKDGTEILACFDWISGGEITVAKYKKTRHGVGYFAPPRSYVQHNFTHWMPLPKPPK